MTTYLYKYRSRDGRILSAHIQAANINEAREKVKNKVHPVEDYDELLEVQESTFFNECRDIGWPLIVVLALIGGCIAFQQQTYNPGGPDPYRDDPLSDPDLYRDRNSPF